MSSPLRFLRAWTGPQPFGFGDEIPGSGEFAGGTIFSLTSDADPSTWEEITLDDYGIPTGTRFAALGLHLETSSDAWADDISLDILVIPEASSLTLLSIVGNVVLLGYGWRRKRKPAG